MNKCSCFKENYLADIILTLSYVLWYTLCIPQCTSFAASRESSMGNVVLRYAVMSELTTNDEHLLDIIRVQLEFLDVKSSK